MQLQSMLNINVKYNKRENSNCKLLTTYYVFSPLEYKLLFNIVPSVAFVCPFHVYSIQ